MVHKKIYYLVSKQTFVRVKTFYDDLSNSVNSAFVNNKLSINAFSGMRIKIFSRLITKPFHLCLQNAITLNIINI